MFSLRKIKPSEKSCVLIQKENQLHSNIRLTIKLWETEHGMNVQKIEYKDNPSTTDLNITVTFNKHLDPVMRNY